MNAWQRINQFLLTYRNAIAAMGRVRIWIPFVVYALIQLALLGLVYLGTRPPFVDFFRGPMNFVVPAGFFHYPTQFLTLPFVFYRLLIPLGAVGESLLMAAATWIFMRHFQSRALPGLGQALGDVRFGFLQFILFWILGAGLLFGWQFVFQATLGDMWVGFGKRRLALQMGNELMKVIFNGLLAYSTVIIIAERSSLWGTLLRSLRTFGRHATATIAFVALSSLLLFPTQYLIYNAGSWLGRFNPEVIVLVLVANVIVGSLSAFLVAGVLTLWYLLNRQPI